MDLGRATPEVLRRATQESARLAVAASQLSRTLQPTLTSATAVRHHSPNTFGIALVMALEKSFRVLGC